MDIGGISSAYTDFIQSQSTAETKLNEKIKSTDYTQANEDELLSACKQFESYFLEQTLNRRYILTRQVATEPAWQARQRLSSFKLSRREIVERL